MEKQVLKTITISSALVVMAAMAFFWINATRVGEITIATPKGPSMTFKVANSNEISELIRNGLANEKSADALSNTLLSIIEHLPPGSMLGEKLLELAERRRSPFLFKSVPVKLVHGSNLEPGLAAVCENSSFSGKNIAVFVVGDDNMMLKQFSVYADVRLMFPCQDSGETLLINSTEVEKFNGHKVLAKRTF